MFNLVKTVYYLLSFFISLLSITKFSQSKLTKLHAGPYNSG